MFAIMIRKLFALFFLLILSLSSLPSLLLHSARR